MQGCAAWCPAGLTQVYGPNEDDEHGAYVNEGTEQL